MEVVYRRKDSTACGRIVNAMSPALYAQSSPRGAMATSGKNGERLA